MRKEPLRYAKYLLQCWSGTRTSEQRPARYRVIINVMDSAAIRREHMGVRRLP